MGSQFNSRGGSWPVALGASRTRTLASSMRAAPLTVADLGVGGPVVGPWTTEVLGCACAGVPWQVRRNRRLSG
jgi:hypothetical protein